MLQIPFHLFQRFYRKWCPGVNKVYFILTDLILFSIFQWLSSMNKYLLFCLLGITIAGKFCIFDKKPILNLFLKHFTTYSVTQISKKSHDLFLCIPGSCKTLISIEYRVRGVSVFASLYPICLNSNSNSSWNVFFLLVVQWFRRRSLFQLMRNIGSWGINIMKRAYLQKWKMIWVRFSLVDISSNFVHRKQKLLVSHARVFNKKIDYKYLLRPI